MKAFLKKENFIKLIAGFLAIALLSAVWFAFPKKVEKVYAEETPVVTVYLNQQSGNDSNNGEEATPVKSLKRAYQIFKEQGRALVSADKNRVVLLGNYYTGVTNATSGLGSIGNNNVGYRITCGDGPAAANFIFPELVSQENDAFWKSGSGTYYIDKLPYFKEFGINISIEATTQKIIYVRGETSAKACSVYQRGDLLVKNIKFQFTGSTNICWYCNGFDLTVDTGCEFSGLDVSSSQTISASGIDNTFLSAFRSMPGFGASSNVPYISIMGCGATAMDMPCYAAYKKDVDDGKALADRYYMGNTIVIKSGRIGRLLGGGRVGDNLYNDGNVNHCNPAKVNYTEREIFNSHIVIDGDDVYIPLVVGGQADRIYYGNSNVELKRGNVYVLCGGNIGNAVTNTYSWADKTRTQRNCSTRNMNDFKGNASVTVSGGNVWYLYGGSLGREHGNCSFRGNIEITVKGTAHVRNTLYGGGAGASVGDLLDLNELNGTSTITNSSKIGDSAVQTAIKNALANNRITRTITVNIEGGTIDCEIYGGGYGVYKGLTKAQIDKSEQVRRYPGLTIANITVNISTGVNNNVYGSGQGGATDIYTESASLIGSSTVNITGSVTGNKNVYGGGKGTAGVDYQARVFGNTTVNLNGATVNGNVYGGAEANLLGGASFGGETFVTVQGSSSVTGSVYGGGLGSTATVMDTNITVAGTAQIGGNVYGGGMDGRLDGTNGSHIQINGGTVSGNVYGGGFGELATVKKTNVEMTNGTINGDLFGGGENGKVSGLGTTIEVDGGTIKGDLFGGGYGSMASVTNASVTLNGGTVKLNAYGGGKLAETAKTTLTVDGANILYNVFGGGSQAPITDHTDGAKVYVASGTIGGNEYGGGESASVEVSYVELSGGTIGNVYGGGLDGKVIGSGATVILNGSTVNDLFGGGYGHSATVDKNTHVTVNKGTVHDVYGGGESGAVLSTTYVTIERVNSLDTLVVTGNVFGGGSMATVQKTNVSVLGGVVHGKIYGGGKEGDVLGDDGTYVLITEPEISVYQANDHIFGNIYGGGQNATVQKTDVEIYGGHVEADVYGGGEGFTATVYQSTDIHVKFRFHFLITEHSGATHDMDLSGATDPEIEIWTTYGDKWELSNEPSFDGKKTDIHTLHNYIGGSVYGGGELGMVGTGRIYSSSHAFVENEATTTVTIENGYIGANVFADTDAYRKAHPSLGSVFGGGKGGTVSLTPTLNQQYGPGSVFGHTIVNIFGGFITNNVFGGGDQSRVYTPENYAGNATEVTIAELLPTEESLRVDVEEGKIPCPDGQLDNLIAGVRAAIAFSYSRAGKTAPQEGEMVVPDYNVLLSASNGDRIIPARNDIAIGRSVFGGGNKGSMASTSASLTTVMGSANVTISALNNGLAAEIYFLEGGIYGDGNLCLVGGVKTVTITYLTNFNHNKTLKTFYSLQRANTFNLVGTDIVLYGAEDLVDSSNSSRLFAINRVNNLILSDGSTVKLRKDVFDLGGLESYLPELGVGDYYSSGMKFVDKGRNMTNGYTMRGGDTANITPIEKGSTFYEYYIAEYERMNEIEFIRQNEICVSNGGALTIKKANGEYGEVRGIMTLSLLSANPGQGGGFVYANIDTSTGGFICVTPHSTTYKIVESSSQALFDLHHYYVKESTYVKANTRHSVLSGGIRYYSYDGVNYNVVAHPVPENFDDYYVHVDYVPATGTYDPGEKYYEINYMDIVHNVGAYKTVTIPIIIGISTAKRSNTPWILSAISVIARRRKISYLCLPTTKRISISSRISKFRVQWNRLSQTKAVRCCKRTSTRA